MKTIKIGNEEIRIGPPSFAALIKAETIQREAGFPEGVLKGEDVIAALKRDPDILHKLASVYYLNDPRSLERWPELWRQWADKYSALQMLPIFEAAAKMTIKGNKIEGLDKTATFRALTQ